MRELYACQLDLRPDTEKSAAVQQLVSEWVARGSGASLEQLEALSDGHLLTEIGHDLDIEQVSSEQGASGWTCSWRRTDDVDPTLLWRVLLAVGSSAEEVGLVRVSIRIALERAGDAFRLSPDRYTFGSPTIVRTLLREHRMLDGGVRVEPRFRERRAGDVSDLVDLLLSAQRRLPVLVLTRHPTAGPLVDASDLARQLAGLAHVEVLSTHLAALALTDDIGKQFSVWGGAARLYWPGFTPDGDPRQYRLWSASRLLSQTDFVVRTRNWLGAAAAAAVPEHPAVKAAKANRRHQLAKTDELPQWVLDYVAETDSELDEAKKEIAELREALNSSQQAEQDANDELVEVREQFHIVQSTARDEPQEAHPVDFDALSVMDAFNLARGEAGEHVTYLDAAGDSIQRFTTYESPRRLYEALSAVTEAAVAWQEGTLNNGFSAYFTERGYGYSRRTPAAHARRTKVQYQRTYDGATVTMEQHLKVDQASSPDQCLRVYWYTDDQQKRLVIGHVGRHLPD